MGDFFIESNEHILDQWWSNQIKTILKTSLGDYDEVTVSQPIPSSLTGFILWLWLKGTGIALNLKFEYEDKFYKVSLAVYRKPRTTGNAHILRPADFHTSISYYMEIDEKKYSKEAFFLLKEPDIHSVMGKIIKDTPLTPYNVVKQQLDELPQINEQINQAKFIFRDGTSIPFSFIEIMFNINTVHNEMKLRAKNKEMIKEALLSLNNINVVIDSRLSFQSRYPTGINLPNWIDTSTIQRLWDLKLSALRSAFTPSNIGDIIGDERYYQLKIKEYINSNFKFHTYVVRCVDIKSNYIIQSNFEIEYDITVQFLANAYFYKTMGYYETRVASLCENESTWNEKELLEVANELSVKIKGSNKKKICQKLRNRINNLLPADFEEELL